VQLYSDSIMASSSTEAATNGSVHTSDVQALKTGYLYKQGMIIIITACGTPCMGYLLVFQIPPATSMHGLEQHQDCLQDSSWDIIVHVARWQH
jgi:hypothetical protein